MYLKLNMCEIGAGYLRLISCCFWLFLLYAWPQLVLASEDPVAAVVSSHIRPFAMALDGFRSGIKGDLETEFVDSNPELVRHRVGNNHYSLVAAIGPAAVKIVWHAVPPETPKLCLMVLDPSELLGDAGVCGVSLRIPPRDQFDIIAGRLGRGSRVGVLFNPDENSWWIQSARGPAVEAGLDLVALNVSSRRDVSSVFMGASSRMDTLLFIPDSTVISEAMISYLIKKALLKGIAPVGYNRFFLETGAVMSFIIDYRGCGKRGARQAMDILAGRTCSMMPPPFEVGWNDKAWKVIQRARASRGRVSGGNAGEQSR